MRTATWSNIGTEVIGATTVEDVLHQAKLDYEVEMRPVFMEDGTIIPNHMATVRTRDNHPFGIVSPKYEVVQNIDAFDFVNHIASEVTFEKAGETQKGMVYIIGRLPDVDILGDTFTPHIIFRNSFAGNYTIAAAICPLRFICQNQFNFSFKNTTNTVNIRHLGNANMRMIEARETLTKTYEYMEQLDSFAENYATKKMSPRQVQWVLDMMFPIKEDAGVRAVNNAQKAKDLFMAAYNSDDNHSFKGTAWGLINAYTDYKTHQEVAESGNVEKRLEARFTRVSMQRPMNRIVEVIEQAA